MLACNSLGKSPDSADTLCKRQGLVIIMVTHSSSGAGVQCCLQTGTLCIGICARPLQQYKQCQYATEACELSASGVHGLVDCVSVHALTAKHCMKACISSIHSKFFLPLLLTFRGTRPVPMVDLRCLGSRTGVHTCITIHCTRAVSTDLALCPGLRCPLIARQLSAIFASAFTGLLMVHY